jgi:hypothetical protein
LRSRDLTSNSNNANLTTTFQKEGRHKGPK